MAAMSAAPAAPSFTPSQSGYSWNISSSGHTEQEAKCQQHPRGQDENDHSTADRVPLASQNGNVVAYGSNSGVVSPDQPSSAKHSNGDKESYEMRSRNPEADYMSPPYEGDAWARGAKNASSPVDSMVDQYEDELADHADDSLKQAANEMHGDSSSGEDSKWIHRDKLTGEDTKWIHRDKLAKIESEELQAAGIILPRVRSRARSKSQSRARRDRDRSQDTHGGHVTRSRKNSTMTTDTKYSESLPHSVPSWDLRTPEEIAAAESEGYWTSNMGTKVSRIPVAKVSPAPIPVEHLERETLTPRKRDHSPGEEETIVYPKPRARSNSVSTSLGKTITNGTTSSLAPPQTKRVDTSPSPRKPSAGTGAGAGSRKASGPKSANGAAGRPKTRGGPSKESASSGRPSTRSGERELSISPTMGTKPMEGDPPWMVSAYRPDPRLPPEQQLLPTVARRLQQEKWEKEGKFEFGNIYDKDFRPLTDEGFLKPPSPSEKVPEPEEGKDEEPQGDWPLKPEAKNPPARSGSYSTMPKISDKPNPSPLPSPRTPTASQFQTSAVVRIPEPPEDPVEKKQSGCACCIVM